VSRTGEQARITKRPQVLVDGGRGHPEPARQLGRRRRRRKNREQTGARRTHQARERLRRAPGLGLPERPHTARAVHDDRRFLR
jgi:hypothetical protein